MTNVTPLRYTRDVAALTDFYTLLGLAEKTSETSRTWTRLTGSGGGLCLHIADQATVEDPARALSLELTVDEGTLDALHGRLSDRGHEPGPITDETFGRYFRVSDPDGCLVQINETPEEFSRSYETEGGRALL